MLGAGLMELFKAPLVHGRRKHVTVVTLAFRCCAVAVGEFIPEGRLQDRTIEHLHSGWLIAMQALDIADASRVASGDGGNKTAREADILLGAIRVDAEHYEGRNA